jgi:hypothetical protein
VETPGQRGIGTVRPASISNGGDPTGIVEQVTWESWGGEVAMGDGVGYYVGPGEGGADARPEPATVFAFDLGDCHGQLAYRAVQWFFPEQGEHYDPSTQQLRTSSGEELTTSIDICPDEVYDSTASSSPGTTPESISSGDMGVDESPSTTIP